MAKRGQNQFTNFSVFDQKRIPHESRPHTRARIKKMAPRCSGERVLIIIFLVVYVVTVYTKGISIDTISPSINESGTDHVSQSEVSSVITSSSLRTKKDEKIRPIVDNFEFEGRRLECLSLITSKVDKLDRMTLVRMPRRKATAYLASEALKVEGDFVEAGVFRGGTAIIMNAILACNNVTDRTLWLADSFAGLPNPEWHEGDQGGKQEVFFGNVIFSTCIYIRYCTMKIKLYRFDSNRFWNMHISDFC